MKNLYNNNILHNNIYFRKIKKKFDYTLSLFIFRI